MAHTFAKYWSWDNLGSNLCMAWVDSNDALQVSCFRGATARLSGRTLPAWDAPVQVELYAREPNLGFYPQGNVYLVYTPLNSSRVGQPAVYRINENLGSGAWSASTLVNYNIVGGLPSTNSGPVPLAQSGGDAGNWFQHYGQTLYYMSNVFAGHEDTPFQSQSTDGSLWDWNKAGQEPDDITLLGRFHPGTLWQWSKAYQLDYVVNPLPSAVNVGSSVQDPMMSRPVRLADGTMAQLIYCSKYYKWRQVTPNQWTWSAISGPTINSQVFSAPVPATGTIVDVALSLPYRAFGDPLIIGQFDTLSKPVRVTIPVPSLPAAVSVPEGYIDVSFINAQNLTITIGNSPGVSQVFPNGFGGTFEGRGRCSYLPDNYNAPNAYLNINPYGYLGKVLSSADITAINAGPGPLVLPITYTGTADSITLHAYNVDPNYSFSQTFQWSIGVYTLSGVVYSPGLSFGETTDFILVTDATFVAAVQAQAGGTATITMQQTTTTHGTTWQNYNATMRYGYQDSVPYFRLIRSRDDGQHWEFAADGAPIAGLDDLRVNQNTPGSTTLMPMLAAEGSCLLIGWVQDGSPQLLVSANQGDTWV